ncbi:MAG: hypothetical protein Q7K57_17925 [Burkholderiaceae bacterium]|nr:hypothetical protein [Burkholderiaceae bacterium]
MDIPVHWSAEDRVAQVPPTIAPLRLRGGAHRHHGFGGAAQRSTDSLRRSIGCARSGETTGQHVFSTGPLTGSSHQMSQD